MKDLLLGLALFSLTAWAGYTAGEFHEQVKQLAAKPKQEQAKVPERAAPYIPPVTPITIIMPNNDQAMGKLAKQVAKELAPKLYKPNETCFGPPYGPSDHPQQLNPMADPALHSLSDQPLYIYSDKPMIYSDKPIIDQSPLPPQQ